MCYSLWYNAATMLPAVGRQHRRCIIPQTVTHSLVLLKMGKIISRNILSWLELLISRYCCILVGCLYCLYQWCTVKQISDNEIYLLIKYIKSVLWIVAKRLSYIEDARCLKVKHCAMVLVNNFVFNHVPFAHPVLLFLCGFIAWFVSLVSEQDASALPVWNQVWML